MLTDGTYLRLNSLFTAADRNEAARLLSEDCSAQAIHINPQYVNDIERCHFAALKLSGGNLDSLIDAIALAQSDYRDLLVAAGFGDNIHAHLDWLPAS